MLSSLIAQAPALNRRCARTFAQIATRLEPLICNWEADALADAIEAVYTSTSAIEPRLLRGRTFFGVIRMPPTDNALSAFQQSVSRSTADSDGLFAEMDLLMSLHERRMPQVRRLIVDLQLEAGVVKKAVSQHLLDLDAFDATLERRAEAAATQASRSAIAALAQKSSEVRLHLESLCQMCKTAQHLLASCQQVLVSWQQLVETLNAHVQPAWKDMSAVLETMKTPAHDQSVKDRRIRLGNARSGFEAWLDTAMAQCQRLQQGAEAAQLAISELQRREAYSGHD
ncbi:MAG: hypothetical protein EOP80_20920 [Variovorax sp.]|nr:MAG: hypothetical protein EOP80_20920 [Variovorax sp.]